MWFAIFIHLVQLVFLKQFLFRTSGIYKDDDNCWLILIRAIIRYMSSPLVIATMYSVGKDDILYCCLPLYHVSGGNMCMGHMVTAGRTVALRRKFSSHEFWKDCSKYKCTVKQRS